MIAFFTRHPTAANLLMGLFLALGLLSLGALRRETFPDFTAYEVQVSVIYPGASAEEVEEGICQRIEDALDGVRFVKEVRSEAREGIGLVTVEMSDGGDFITFKDEVQTEVGAITDFPAEAEPAIIAQLGTTDPVLSILVAGPMRPPDLKAFCEELKDRLQEEGHSLVTVRGFSDHQFRIEFSRETLVRHGLSVTAIADTIARQSLNLPAGSLKTSDQDVLLRFTEERRSIQELEDIIVVGGLGGAELRLGDLGRVVDTFEVDEDKVLLNGQRAGLLLVEKNKNQDVIRVAGQVRAFVERAQAEYPQVEFQVLNDLSILVQDRLLMLTKNGWQGLLLVFLTMWLFFNVRLSFWVVASLPVSFLGGFFLFPLLGMTINMLTMVGLLIALGLLMDDGIVIAENVAAHLERGKPPLAAAIDGVNEVKWGVISSFITTICVLGTLVSIEGDIGRVLYVVPVVLILVLAVSLIEAFCILPAHLAHSLHGHEQEQPGRIRRGMERGLTRLRDDGFGPLVDRLLAWRYLFLGAVIGLFFVSVGLVLGGWVKFTAFPDVDGDVVVARVLLPPGTPLSRTEAVVDQLIGGIQRVNQRLKAAQPGGADLVKSTYTEFNKNLDAFENGAHVATVSAELLGAEIRNTALDDVLQAWREEVGDIPDVVSLNITEPGFGPAGRAIEIRFQGRELARLREAAATVEGWMQEFEGVYNLTVDLRPSKREIRIRLREGALGRGVDAQLVAAQLRAAFQGTVTDEIQVGPEAYEITVQFPPPDRDSWADLEEFYVTLGDGTQVPLGAVAEWETGAGWSRIARIDGLRTVTLRGDTDAREINTSELFRTLASELMPEIRTRLPDVRIDFQGEVAEGQTTQQSMWRSMMIGVIGVYILLSFQFRSYTEPLIVMLAIPLASIGVVFGHWLLGADLSMPSMLGFVSLAGIVVNDSILLVLFLKQELTRGRPIPQAAAQASRLRFRAILLTSVTTAAGLLPLLAEKSLQAQVLIPLAISIVFGLLASTVLVLAVIPCSYLVFADLGLLKSAEPPSEP